MTIFNLPMIHFYPPFLVISILIKIVPNIIFHEHYFKESIIIS